MIKNINAYGILVKQWHILDIVRPNAPKIIGGDNPALHADIIKGGTAYDHHHPRVVMKEGTLRKRPQPFNQANKARPKPST